MGQGWGRFLSGVLQRLHTETDFSDVLGKYGHGRAGVPPLHAVVGQVFTTSGT